MYSYNYVKGDLLSDVNDENVLMIECFKEGE